jgi:hypothetical protein
MRYNPEPCGYRLAVCSETAIAERSKPYVQSYVSVETRVAGEPPAIMQLSPATRRGLGANNFGTSLAQKHGGKNKKKMKRLGKKSYRRICAKGGGGRIILQQKAVILQI